MVQLVVIDKSNWEVAAKLEVRDDQKTFVATNVWTLAETQFYPWATRMAVYDDTVMVGFLAFGRDPNDDKYWLFRFMIDARFQGQSYGKQALTALIAHLHALPDCTGITVGYQPDNIIAERLYLAVGFVKGGPAPWGEFTARLTFAKR